MKRNRLIYLLATGAVIALGLLSRRNPSLLPAALGKYPGDALWAAMVFCGSGALCPQLRTCAIGAMALAFSCAVEFSQRYHAPWLDSLRGTTLGQLVLGSGFSWLDMVAYAVGILAACLVEMGLRRWRGKK